MKNSKRLFIILIATCIAGYCINAAAATDKKITIIQGGTTAFEANIADVDSIVFSSPAPVIESISSDMPIPGMKLVINGKYFTYVEYIDINNGEIIIHPEDMNEITDQKLSFIMPAKPSKRCNLKVVTSYGTAVMRNFYPYEQLLTDFDEIGKYEAWCESGVDFVDADSTNLPYPTDKQCALMTYYNRQTWFGPAIAMFKDTAAYKESIIFPSFDYIPENTPSSEVYLAYECYNKYSFENLATFVRYEFLVATIDDKDGTPGVQGAYTYENYNNDTQKPKETSHPGYDGVPLYNEWYTVMIPLNKFTEFRGATYGDICGEELIMLHFVIINKTNNRDRVDISFDNVRFVTKSK